MKKLITLLLTLVATLVLVACGPSSSEGTEGETIDFSERYQKGVTIRVWIDDEDGAYMERIIEEFNKIYPNIHVQHQHKGSVDAREHLKTFGPSGNGADVFQFPHDHLAQAVLEDLVLPLPTATAELVRERSHQLGVDIATLYYDEDTGSFDPNNPNAVERLYAVPMSVEAVGLYYNIDLLDKLVDMEIAETNEPVTTYEELIRQAKLWNESPVSETDTRTNAIAGNFFYGTTSHWADSYFIQHIYSAFKFTPFGPDLNDHSRVGFEDLEPALTWMREELKPITTGNGDHNSVGGGGLFEAGSIPYVLGGPWNSEGFKNNNINFGVAKLPSINGEETQPFAGAMMAAVYKYSDNAEAATRFVEFLSSDIAMQLQYEMKQKLPALNQELLANIPGVLEDQAMNAMSIQLEDAVPMPTIPQVTYYWGPGETMVISIWNASADIAAAVVEAETSYRTLAKLTS
ncbi:MAG TPA: extracellular solute-binding protein [Acholeplasmataceae bacterium]|nr:extracellular solute-binding protein [Acholeplasmataceae bacterium]